MTVTEEFNCIYCEKIYKTSGWLASHIRKKHDDSNLLEKDMTVMRDIALDLSNKEAALNLSENSRGTTTLPFKFPMEQLLPPTLLSQSLCTPMKNLW